MKKKFKNKLKLHKKVITKLTDREIFSMKGGAALNDGGENGANNESIRISCYPYVCPDA